MTSSSYHLRDQNSVDKLVGHLTVSDVSDTSPTTYNTNPARSEEGDGEAPTIERQLTANTIIGPIAHPALERAVDEWLLTKASSVSEMETGAAFSKAIGIRPSRRLKHCLRAFTTLASLFGLPGGDLPTVSDVRYGRNRVRALRALAFVARNVDEERWAQIANTLPLGNGWPDVMLEEGWQGDATARRLARLVKARGIMHGTIVVAGRQGVGKSALIARLLGCRLAFPPSHVLSVPVEFAEGDEYEGIVREFAAYTWPFSAIRVNMPAGSTDADHFFAKLDGFVLAITELPGLEEGVDGIDELGQYSHVRFGDVDELTEKLQYERAAIVVVVDRLDEFDQDLFITNLGKLVELYGRAVIAKLMIVLTHGQSLPASDLTYEVWTFDQIRQVKLALQQAFGQRFDEDVQRVPIVVFENSEQCRRVEDRQGSPLVLPNGVQFIQRFVEEFERVLNRAEGSEVVPPFVQANPLKRWWEPFLMFGVLVLFAYRSRY